MTSSPKRRGRGREGRPCVVWCDASLSTPAMRVLSTLNSVDAKKHERPRHGKLMTPDRGKEGSMGVEYVHYLIPEDNAYHGTEEDTHCEACSPYHSARLDGVLVRFPSALRLRVLSA
jgi:hypothetical protein